MLYGLPAHNASYDVASGSGDKIALIYFGKIAFIYLFWFTTQVPRLHITR